MNYRYNYHTHSTFCDGEQSLETMAKAAYSQGLQVLGFSSHTVHPFASFWHMDTRNYDTYFHDIEKLKLEYAGKMEILSGIEADFLPPISYSDKNAYKDYSIDYMIGSVHYIINDDTTLKGCFTVDGPASEFYKGVEQFFNGDSKKAIQTYFCLLRDMINTCDFDIVGHVDLVRKRNGELRFFDENDSWYRNELKETAKALGKSNKVVEINTGGMTRVGLKEPYPSKDFLTLLKSQNVPVMISSDCHTSEHLTDHFTEALQAAKDSGYTSVHHLSKGIWSSSEI